MYVITTNPASRGSKWTHPLWWSATGIVGIMASGHALKFVTMDQAYAEFNRIPLETRAFHDLAVLPHSPGLHDLNWSPPRRFA